MCCWVENLKDFEKRAGGSQYIPWFGEALCVLNRKTIASRISSCNSFPPGFFFSSQEAAARIDSREERLASLKTTARWEASRE